MTLAFFILITACIAAYFLTPLLRPEGPKLTDVDSGAERRALEAEKESYLRAMQDIEFEHASRKINDEDYAELRRHYGGLAAKTMRALEQLKDPDSPVAADKESSDTPDEPASKKEMKDLASSIAAVKENIDFLERDWDSGTIDDTQYIKLHDEYMEQLETLLARLDRDRGSNG